MEMEKDRKSRVILAIIVACVFFAFAARGATVGLHPIVIVALVGFGTLFCFLLWRSSGLSTVEHSKTRD
ncbi:hypothetical protein A2673_01320 [Candidatus Kaiserbacteria bacterium RIFCSPHIGHO2_01_FULL_50_13]|nr:MAG: hypothetical protein A2673_01320 [Candidatus Kaiserbacteria bacterium RIFCSPHIGHO2_01_FULL_50_13]OGG81083.1 MAG: hypothetical protein A3H74_04145 [Candidatus Kaiserbacteria bacterium RIFCSPLOWO2_02_FULL_51_13]